MKLIIDRFENGFAVCEKEDGTFIDIVRTKLPDGCREGDCLLIDGNSINIDKEETQNRKDKIKKLMNDLF